MSELSDDDSIENAIEQASDEGYLDNAQDDTNEIEQCPDCGRLQCICDTEFVGYTIELNDEAERYLDKRLSDREDFHSDDSRFDIFDEPDYPEY